MSVNLIKASGDARDFLFGALTDKPTEEVFWDTTLLPPVLDKKGYLVAVTPDLFQSDIAHAFCNAMEMYLNEIGEASQLDRACLQFDQETLSLSDYVQAMRKIGMTAHAGDRPVKQVTRYERLNSLHLIDDLRVALFCNLLPVISFRCNSEMFGTDVYCATVVGVNCVKGYVECASHKGYEFGTNGFFVLDFDYINDNVLDAFVIREVSGLKTMIPEELYNRAMTRDTMDFAPATHTDSATNHRGWRKMLDFFRGS